MLVGPREIADNFPNFWPIFMNEAPNESSWAVESDFDLGLTLKITGVT